MSSPQRKRLEGAMSKLVGVAKASEQNTSHLSSVEVHQPTKHIAIDSIRRSPFQPRIHLDPEHINALSESIRNTTLANPIVVRAMDDNEYELIAGENRLEAVKLLGEQEILAVIRRVDDRTARLLAVADNLARKDLSDYEQGVAFQKMLDDCVVRNIKELAEHLGTSRVHVHSCLAFNAFPSEAHDILKKMPGLIGARLALELKDFCLKENTPVIIEAIELIGAKKLLQGNAVAWIKQKLSAPAQTTTLSKDKTHWAALNGQVKATLKSDLRGLTLKLKFNPSKVAHDKIETAIRSALASL